MKYQGLSVFFLSLVVASCTSDSVRRHYDKLEPVSAEDKISLSCEQIEMEIEIAERFLTNVGEISSLENAGANASIALTILRASTGGYDSTDMTFRADRNEKLDAINKGKARLNGLHALQLEKECLDERDDSL